MTRAVGGARPARGGGARDDELRRLRYRLRRQGMLELDEWLGGLEPELASMGAEERRALARMLAETPAADLLAIMHGELAPPPELAARLGLQ